MINENNKKLIHRGSELNKILKSLFFIAMLLLMNSLSGVFFGEPRNDVYLILWRLLLFFISLIFTGALMHFMRPHTIKLIILPVYLIAFFLMATN